MIPPNLTGGGPPGSEPGLVELRLREKLPKTLERHNYNLHKNDRKKCRKQNDGETLGEIPICINSGTLEF